MTANTDRNPESALSGFSFSHATRQIVFGAGTFAQIGTFVRGAKRGFVIVDPFFATHPAQAKLGEILQSVVFHSIPDGEPTAASVTAATQALESTDPDVVIALGGGSAIDTAKSALAFAANPGRLEALFWPEAQIVNAHPARFIAIPTTAGSGSEVSETAIVDLPHTIYQAHMRAPSIAPEVAILDPELSLSTPRSVTVASGFDALTHAIEAYTSRAANPMTDPVALSGAALLIGNLARVAVVPDDLAARGACLLGSAQAGIAFNSAHLGLAHAIAGALGALHHVPHGLANALALPWTMAFNRADTGDKEYTIAALLDAPSTAAGLSRLRYDLGLDHTLDDYVTGSSALDGVAAAAMTSGQIAMNPREPVQADIRAILEAMRRPTGGAEPELSL